ncbi:hypothetical protein GOP47_0005063 [Adiantum capillus-veneris]|uniref:Tryptophan synthase beta chain-like PALP domain-containing protein n=1 Tax=Adiantum capillus-veneris TaxID=13818 RepID=A0A9D4ZL85_ADICA|nr:hypothetical protein GOP47_0005063 [Adiantum capillus-veneris]
MAAMQATLGVSSPSLSLCKSSFLGSVSCLSRVASAVARSPIRALKVEAKKGAWLPGLAFPTYLDRNLAGLQNGRQGRVLHPRLHSLCDRVHLVPLCGGEKMARHQVPSHTTLQERALLTTYLPIWLTHGITPLFRPCKACKANRKDSFGGAQEYSQQRRSPSSNHREARHGICTCSICFGIHAFEPPCDSDTMIEDAKRRGLIKPGLTTLIEPTSKNIAISLAFVGIHKGYKVVAVMPVSYSLERCMILRALGAEIYLRDPSVWIARLFARAKEMVATRPNNYMLNQAMNTMNPGAHFQSRGPEIQLGRWIFSWREQPSESPVLSGGCKGPHKIQEIGPAFIPATMDVSLADEIVTVTTEESMTYACQLAKEGGLLAGISSGTAVSASLKCSRSPLVFTVFQVSKRSKNVGKLIVTILPSGAERYLTSDLFAAIREESEIMEF